MTSEEFKQLIVSKSDICINYKVNGIQDHNFVQSLGFNIIKTKDYYCYSPELSGIILSSYGNWGQIKPSELNNTSREICLKMIDDNIIRFFRI